MTTVTATPNATEGGPDVGAFTGFGFDGRPVGIARRVTLTTVGNYVTGGDALTLAGTGLRNVYRMFVEGGASTLGMTPQLATPGPAPKIQLFVAATGGSGAVAEVANAVATGGKSFTAILIGD